MGARAVNRLPAPGDSSTSTGLMAKTGRELIKLESTAGTGVFYVTSKNKRTMTGKLELKKYDKKVRKHVKFVEKKIK